MAGKGAVVGLVGVLLLVASPASGGSSGPMTAPSVGTAAARASSSGDKAVGVEVVGAFAAGAPLNGAMLSGDRFYATTADRLSIFDASEPRVPVLLASVPSVNPINGEQISTNDVWLLLNSFTRGGTLDVWNVEDATNPVLVATLGGVADQHVSCLLDCSWAYGSAGSVIDLRRPDSPQRVHSVNWKDELGIESRSVHRVDEIRDGLAAVAPRNAPPLVLDVRNPLKPRVVARATRAFYAEGHPFLYARWPVRGRSRYLLASIELRTAQRCEGEDAHLVSFDAKDLRETHRFPLVDRYAAESAQGCLGLYFSEHPRFESTGLIALAVALDGVRVVKVGERGRIAEVASFQPLVADVWHAYWVDDEILYVPNLTGEIYILRYLP